MKKNNKKGFTLAELLIVVAIIAVLVAVAIPVFTTQLEKSKLATDTANVRSAYAELVAEALADGKTPAITADSLSSLLPKDSVNSGTTISVGANQITISRAVGSNVIAVDKDCTSSVTNYVGEKS